VKSTLPFFTNQKSLVIWLTGLSGAGKTTIAALLKKKFEKNSVFSVILDGDVLRNTINKNLGYTDEDRRENVRRAAEIANLFLENNIVTICTFMSPTEEMRSIAKEIVGAERFYEVYIKASLQNCVARDVKGLYAKYNAGQLKNMSGIDALYQEPIHPFLVINTNELSAEASSTLLYDSMIALIQG
jgi:adenylyl-sulfate kinase